MKRGLAGPVPSWVNGTGKWRKQAGICRNKKVANFLAPGRAFCKYIPVRDGKPQSKQTNKMKTESPELVRKHCFEAAGLGIAPFRFVGLSENAVRYPDGTSKAGGSCDYCGNGIRHECHVKSADGRVFKVGSDCIAKVGDAGLYRAFKASPEWRKHQRDLAAAKARRVFEEVQGLISANADKLRALPHPRGFVDRATGQPLTCLDQAEWLRDHCGAAGMKSTLFWLKRILN